LEIYRRLAEVSALSPLLLDTERAFLLSDSAALQSSVFRHFDRDASGSIDQQELNAALRGFGYNLSRELLELIMIKYSRPYLIHNAYQIE